MGKYPVQNTRALEWKEQSRDEGVPRSRSRSRGAEREGNPIQQCNVM
jgi:hypothetical protein